MIGLPRRCGRHRDGQPYTPVYRRVWDGPARAEAERLDQTWANWTVLYSLGRRSFYAVAAWDGPRPVMVEDATADGLEQRMHEAETTRMIRIRTEAESLATNRRGGSHSQVSAAAPSYSPHRPGRRRRAA
ncbi:hypothetical protein [Streptosporangium sp. NPDC020145]|uniref:hypothetical protein n=1 Tax=Streptosporangium sp. NPDC020145 TaxID=3154694 RepID=UPI00342F408A